MSQHTSPGYQILYPCAENDFLFSDRVVCAIIKENADVGAPKPLRPNVRKITLPWGNEDTQTLIDILGKYNVRATFFVVGAWVDKYPESVKALAEAGHEVMSHSDDHAHFSQLTSAQITENLSTCNDKIEAVTGVRPTLFRCPYGEYDDHVIEAVNSLGMHAIQWDVEAYETDSSPFMPHLPS